MSRGRMTILVLALVMLLTVAGCGAKEDSLLPGYDYLDKGNIQEAIKAFEAMIDEDKTDSEGWLGLAESYWAAGEHEKALETLVEGMKCVEGETEDKLKELYGNIEDSITEAVDVTPVEPHEPVKPPESEQQEETNGENGEPNESGQEEQTPDEQEPETALTVDYTLLEQAVFSNHGELNRIYGGYTSEYNYLGWMVKYTDSHIYGFYGYDATLVNGDGIPYDDSMPNLVMIDQASALVSGGDTASLADIKVLFGTVECQENVMDGGYAVVCEYKGSTVAFDSDAEGNIDLENALVQIYSD